MTTIYKVYQCEYAQNETEDERELRLQISCDGNINKGNTHLLKHVANVDAECMTHAFEIMNLWDEPQRVEKLNERVTSLSVGNVLVDVDGVAWVVAGVGFERVDCPIGADLPYYPICR